MRTVTTTTRIGERVGDIDWSYDFRSHFNNYCTSDERRDEFCEQAKQTLRMIEQKFKAGEKVQATTYGGWPRFGYGEVLNVGMYDGWPYWRPVPSVLIQGPLGGEWTAFSDITDTIPDLSRKQGDAA